MSICYVVIRLKNGEVYQGISAELGPKGYGYGDEDTQGVWLQRYGCSTFIPGQDVESIKWVECRDEDDAAESPEPKIMEPELTLV